MVATTVCFTAGLTGRARVDTVGGIGFTNYRPALTIPYQRLPTGHDLLFITSGIAGNFMRLSQTAPTFAEVVPYFGTPQLGTPQLAQVFRQLFSFAPYRESGTPVQESQTGQPFFMMTMKTNWPATTDFHVAAQLHFEGTPQGVTGTFDIDALAVQVWDLTELNTLGIGWEWRENITEVDLPDSATTPMTLQNFTRVHGTSVNWFIATYVNITPKSEGSAAQFWLDNGTASEHFTQRIKPMLHGLPPGTPTRYDFQFYPLGQFGTFTLPSTWTLRTRAQDGYTGGIRSRHHVSATFAVHMVPETYLEGPTLNPQPGFWGTGNPWDGDDKTLQKTTFPYYVAGIVMANVATGPVLVPGRWRTLLEADGSTVSSNNPLAVLARSPIESMPQQRVVTYSFGGGKHWLRFRGNKHPADPQPPLLKYDADDCFLFAFNGVLGVIPPAEVFEGPGPETAILANKETAVSVAALPALPFQPSFGAQVSVEGETRETRIPAGYDITHPRFEKGRRTVRLTWQALTAADAVTLVTFARNLAATDGAFRWQMVGDLAERPYSVIEATIPEVDLGSGGPRSVSFDALELLFYVP